MYILSHFRRTPKTAKTDSTIITPRHKYKYKLYDLKRKCFQPYRYVSNSRAELL